jgi:uncharacterized membrane protein
MMPAALLAEQICPLSRRRVAEMGKLFWVFLAGLAGIGIHILYVLLLPSAVFQRDVQALTKDGKTNSLQLMQPNDQSALLPGFAGDSVTAVCRIDVSKGKVGLSLKVPSTYWTLAIYSQSGRQTYALNDKQAGVDSFEIVVSKARSLLEQVANVGNADDANDDIANAAWNVEIPDRQGLAFLWIPLTNALSRPAVEAVVKESKCAVKDAAG